MKIGLLAIIVQQTNASLETIPHLPRSRLTLLAAVQWQVQ